jgi:hypothetical protein
VNSDNINILIPLTDNGFDLTDWFSPLTFLYLNKENTKNILLVDYNIKANNILTPKTNYQKKVLICIDKNKFLYIDNCLREWDQKTKNNPLEEIGKIKFFENEFYFFDSI